MKTTPMNPQPSEAKRQSTPVRDCSRWRNAPASILDLAPRECLTPKQRAILAQGVAKANAFINKGEAQLATGWATENDVDTYFFNDGFDYRGRHWDAEDTRCSGLRRYGVRRNADLEESEYHRFQCFVQLFRSDLTLLS